MARKIDQFTIYNLRFTILKIGLSAALLFMLCIGGHSQRFPYTFEHVRIDGSSLDNLVYSMLKDSRGYLWLGTSNGLKRYDPNFTVSYKKEKDNKKSLINNNVESLCEDKQGRIWAGTTEGVCFLDRKTNLFTRIEEVHKADFACRNIICDSRGDIWFTIRDGGLYKYDTKTNKLTNFRHDNNKPNSLSHNRISMNGLVEDPSKKGLWIACQDKLNYFDFASQSFNHSGNNPKNIAILTASNKTALTFHNNIFVYSDNALGEICWYNTHQQKVIKTHKVVDSEGKTHSEFSKIFFDSNNDLWIGTYENITIYVNSLLSKTIILKDEKGTKKSFPSHSYTAILQEESGSLWFGNYNGLSIINGIAVKKPDEQLFSIYDFSKQMFSKNIDDIIIDFVEDSQDKTWWILTTQKRLLNYNPITETYKEFKAPANPELKEHDIVFSMRQYNRKLFIFKSRNIYVFDKLTHQFEEIKIGKEVNFAEYFGITSSIVLGDSLWVFTKSRNKLDTYNYHLKKKRWSVYPVIYGKNTVKLNDTRDIHVAKSLVTKKGEFWLAIHSGGLAKFNPKLNGFEVIKTKQDIDFTKVGYHAFDEDKEGNIWVSTFDLVKFNPKTYDFKSIIDVDILGPMVVDDNDNICTVTFDEFMFFNQKTSETYYFTLNNNILEGTIGIDLHKLSNGKLLSRNSQSVVVINYKDFKIPSANDKLYLARLSTADTVIHLNESNVEINLKPNQNSLSIAYGVLAPPNMQLYRFYYQLEGFDKDWRLDKSQTRYAIYGNLDGGEYVFKVKAMDLNGKFLPEQKLLINIATPFYKTIWFKIIGFLVAANLAIAFIRYRANQRKKIYHLQLQSTRLAKDKTEIQYQNLINHLNPHFLFNSLTSLNSLIITEPRQASKFLQKLSAIYRYILQNKEKESVTIEHELNFVKNYIDLQKSRFDDGLEIIIDIDDDYLGYSIVPVTLQNLFENAIKHNIIEDERPLRIEVYIEDDFLIVRNNLQKKGFVETSNKQGLDSLRSLYSYLTTKPFETIETEQYFIVRIPLI